MTQTTSHSLALPPSTSESPISLSMFLERSISYEREWPTPLDTQLRRHLLISLASTLGVIPLSVFLLALLTSLGQGGFFLFGRAFAVGTLALLLSPVGVTTIALTILGHAALWYKSDGLQAAAWHWHQLALGLAVAGAMYLVLLGLPVLLVVLNLAVWLLIILACLFGILIWATGGTAVAVVARR